MKQDEGMSEKQAARIIEQFENGTRNGEQWAHDVCLHRGTEKYERSLALLNEAFRIKCIDRQIEPLPLENGAVSVRRSPRR